MNSSPVLILVGGLAFVLLCVAFRSKASQATRAWLTIFSSAFLIWLVSESILGLALFALDVVLVVITWRVCKSRWWLVWIGILIALMVANKLALNTSLDQTSLAGSAVWLGFSFISFRLIHLTIDGHAGRSGDAALPEIMVYVLHPASLLAGPIDRVQASVKAQRDNQPAAVSEDIHQGLWRILRGAALKFMVANPLFAFISVFDMVRNPNRPVFVAWLWLIAYSVYLLADFAGYTDMAIGFGRLAGLRLPENFSHPYASSSITAFWQRWHISLSSWLRDYIFFPLSRALLRRTRNRFRPAIQFVAHLTTMIICGLWHGIAPGYVVWGIWHGFGLFIHGRLVVARPAQAGQRGPNLLQKALGVAGTTLFVMSGWVFFVTDPPTAVRIFGRLLGIT